MYCVMGKSKAKEYSSKQSEKTYLTRFKSDAKPYPVSPDFFDMAGCNQFINLCKDSSDIRCIAIAEFEPKFDKDGEVELDKRNKPKGRYKIIRNLLKPAAAN